MSRLTEADVSSKNGLYKVVISRDYKLCCAAPWRLMGNGHIRTIATVYGIARLILSNSEIQLNLGDE